MADRVKRGKGRGVWDRVLPASRAARILSLVVAVLLLAVGVTVAWPRLPGPPIHHEAHRIKVTPEQQWNLDVELDTTLFVPARTPAPAVILAHGLSGSKADLRDDAETLARRGYVVLTFSARGHGASGGYVSLDSLDHEIRDGSMLIDWLAARPEVQLDKPGDPRLGIAGFSYGGAFTLMVAGTDARVDAIAPAATWHDLSGVLFEQRITTAPPGPTPAAHEPADGGVLKQQWAARLLSGLVGSALRPTGPDPDDPAASTTTAGRPNGAGAGGPGGASATPPGAQVKVYRCGRLRPDLCQAYQDAQRTGAQTPALRELLARSNPSAVAGEIKAPTLLLQGTHDSLFGLSEADANARAVAAAGTPVAVSWFAGGHDGGDPDLVVRTQTTEWFDRWLKDGKATIPGFRYVFQGPPNPRGAGRLTPMEADNYPGLPGSAPTGAAAGSATPVRGNTQAVVNPSGGVPAALSVLPGMGVLAASAASAAAGPGGSEGSGGSGGSAAMADRAAGALTPGQFASFTTPPVDERTDVVGTVRVTLAVSPTPVSPAPGEPPVPNVEHPTEVPLFLRWSSLPESGPATLRGGAVAAIRIPRPQGDQPVQVAVNLAPGTVRLEPGSRLLIQVATTDQGFLGSSDPASYQIAVSDVLVPGAVGRATQGSSLNPLLIGVLGVAVALGALGLLVTGRPPRRRRRTNSSVATGTEAGVASDDAADTDEEDVPLVVSRLHKRYENGYVAVHDVSFELRPGQVLGLLGPNGAGKTTTLRMVMGLITPTAGSVKVFGHEVKPGEPVLSRIGSFVEGSGFLPHLSGRQNLELFWAATGRPTEDAHFDEVLKVAALGAAVERRVSTYSRGMRQRLAVAQAMLGLPQVLILDEPTNGLDPPQIHAMREVLRHYAHDGRAVLVSSHLLGEIEQTCTHAVVMAQGRTIAAGTVADLVHAAAGVSFDVDDPAAAEAVLEAHWPGTVTGEAGGHLVAHVPRDEIPDAVAALVAAGVAVLGVAPRQRLEDVFLSLVAPPHSEETAETDGDNDSDRREQP